MLVGALALSGLFNPIVNAPMGAVMLSRTPAALRASAGSVAIVLTAVCSPLALTAAGAALAHAGARPVLVVALAEQTFAVALFAGAALRERRGSGRSPPRTRSGSRSASSASRGGRARRTPTP